MNIKNFRGVKILGKFWENFWDGGSKNFGGDKFSKTRL